MNKKRIGIVAWKTGDNSIGITAPYYEYFSRFGEIQALFPSQPIITDLDLLVLPGGSDINPMRYGQEPEIFTNNADIFKEYFDVNKLPGYIEARVPVFGVCRGLQSISVHFGGKLIQSAPHPYYSSERSELVHSVVPIRPDGKTGTSFKVNSMHHQCVDPGHIGDGLIVILQSKDDGVIEGLSHKELKISSVQFHPEELGYERFSDSLIEKLLTR